MSDLRRGGDHDRPGWPLAIEASAWLALAAIALRVLSFARIVSLIAPSHRAERVPSSRAVLRVARAVDAATRRAPWRALCFERALAAGAMLRLRGYAPVLYYGAKTGGARGVAAHVWVRVSGMDVIGCEEAPGFALLARFPPDGGDVATPS